MSYWVYTFFDALGSCNKLYFVSILYFSGSGSNVPIIKQNMVFLMLPLRIISQAHPVVPPLDCICAQFVLLKSIISKPWSNLWSWIFINYNCNFYILDDVLETYLTLSAKLPVNCQFPVFLAGTPFRTSWITPSSRRTTACTWSWQRRTTWWSRAWSCGCEWTTPRSSMENTRTTTPSSSSLSSTKTCPRRSLRRW